jgi:HEAT repeat protein
MKLGSAATFLLVSCSLTSRSASGQNPGDVDRLLESIEDPNFDARKRACEALLRGRAGLDRLALRLKSLLETTPSWTEQDVMRMRTTAGCAQRMGPKASITIPALIALLKSSFEIGPAKRTDQLSYLRQELITALAAAGHGDPRAAAAIVEATKRMPASDLELAIAALKEAGLAGRQRLVALLLHPEPRVRMRAVEVIAELDRAAADVLPEIIRSMPTLADDTLTNLLGRMPLGPEARVAVPELKRRIRGGNPNLAKAAAEALLSIDPMDAEARATFKATAGVADQQRAVVFGKWSAREKKGHFEITRLAANSWKGLESGSRLWVASLFGQAEGTLLRQSTDASGHLSVDVISDEPVAPEGPILLSTRPFPEQSWEVASAEPDHVQRAESLVLSEMKKVWTSYKTSVGKEPHRDLPWVCPWYKPGMKNLPPEVELEVRLIRTTLPRPAEYFLAKVPDCIESEYVGGGDYLLVEMGAGRPFAVLSHREGFGARPFLDVDGDGFPELIGSVPVGGTEYRSLFRMLPKAATVTDECLYFQECP